MAPTATVSQAAASGAKRTGRRARHWLLLAAALVALLAVVAYLLAAYVVYLDASSTKPDAKDAARFAGVNPANLVFSLDGVSYDFNRLAMADYEDVRFASRDPGIEIAAWFVPAGPGAPAVIATHGRRSSRHDPAVLVPAAMLHAHGYSVLIIDMRDHGDSTYEDGRFAGGIEEQNDVLGGFDWLISQGVPAERIGLYGASMGAAVTLIAAAHEPRIGVVWEDSSYADTLTRISDELAHNGAPTILTPAAQLMATIVSGDDITSITPLSAVQTLPATTDLYIAHGALDDQTYAEHALDLYRAAVVRGIPVELWIVPGMNHTQAYRRLPDEYETRLVQFFNAYLMPAQ